jgi:hypothetical protein
MTVRCNCDASCGENRYHDVGDPECRFNDIHEYNAYYFRTKKEDKKVAKDLTLEEQEVERLRAALRTIGNVFLKFQMNGLDKDVAIDIAWQIVDDALTGDWPAFGVIPKSADVYNAERHVK